jgi:hypothetical protein
MLGKVKDKEAEPMFGEPKDERAIRGYAIFAKGDEPKQVKENVFRVPSQNCIVHVQIISIGKLHASTFMQ